MMVHIDFRLLSYRLLNHEFNFTAGGMMQIFSALVDAARRISKALHEPTPYRSKSAFLNKFGYQSIRMVTKRSWYRIKTPPRTPNYADYKKSLDTDGIVVIENFLPQALFDSLQAEYNRACSDPKKGGVRMSSGGGCDNRAIVFSADDPRFPVTNSAVRQNSLIAELVGHICKMPVDYFLDTMSFLEQKLSAGAAKAADGNTFLHADTHYPTSKAVLYITDVTEGDAPFVYCLGSHRMSLGRLAVENELTTRLGKLKLGEFTNYSLRVFDRVPEILPDQFERLRLAPKPIYARANTLIIADHCGFHARGDFMAERKRVTLRVSFRFMDAPRYKFRTLLNPIYKALKRPGKCDRRTE